MLPLNLTLLRCASSTSEVRSIYRLIPNRLPLLDTWASVCYPQVQGHVRRRLEVSDYQSAYACIDSQHDIILRSFV